MKNLDMLFINKLPTDLYTKFQIIKLLIKNGNLNFIHNKITYQHYKYQISSSQSLPTYQHPYMQETRKIDRVHDFILYTRNFQQEMEIKYFIMGSINGNKQ